MAAGKMRPGIHNVRRASYRFDGSDAAAPPPVFVMVTEKTHGVPRRRSKTA